MGKKKKISSREGSSCDIRGLGEELETPHPQNNHAVD